MAEKYVITLMLSTLHQAFMSLCPLSSNSCCLLCMTTENFTTDADQSIVHDPDYRASWKDFETFLDALTQGITTVDETVPELPIKDIVSTALPSYLSFEIHISVDL
jgi:hypothetical protein